jgi:hypothetical protein
VKNLLCFIIVLIVIIPAKAQKTASPTYKVIPLTTKETFTLNSGGRALIGGKSRIPLLVELPPNTVEWYYAIVTTPEKAPPPAIGLADQLIKYLTPSGIASTFVSSLITQSGSGTCDVYLFADQNNLNTFLSKRGQAHCLMSGTRENFSQGAVEIRDAVQGNYFLGLRNPSGLAAVQITIEVCAIVRE